jgi:5-methylthioribose kinase
MCAVTEQVIFSDPYVEAPLNNHNSPHLDAIVKCIRSDCELLQAASVLKGASYTYLICMYTFYYLNTHIPTVGKFLGHTQALLHGDLHSGSIMVSESSTFVIDPEFAFYGPMGFDLGALLSNLFFSYFSQEPAAGFDQRAESRESEFAAWVIEQIALWHSTFEREFTLRFEELSKGKGEFFTGGIASTPTTLAVALRAFLSELWLDTLGFAGMKMTRRIIGLAHVADLEEIEDPAHRSVCEKKCLLLARILVVSSQERGSAGGQVIGDMPRLLSVARKVYALPASSVEGMDDFSLKWKVLY